MNQLVRSNEWSRNPFAPLNANWWDLVPSRFFQDTAGVADKVPAVDIKETDAEFQVVADLPGISKENLDVSVKGDILSIVVSSHDENEEKSDGRVIRRERHQGKLTRYFKLSDFVDSENIHANYKDGVLNITVPKKESKQPRKIEISVH